MAARIAFIGAGSLGFTRGLVRDILTFDLLKDATLVLMDIDRERLDFARKACQTIIDRGNYPAKIVATMDRREALKGANAVLCTILAGGVDVWKHDILIPKKYGIDTCVGDTRSVSGVFRALRTIPVMISIAKDMEKLCPDAILLNYTNPMAMLCRAIQKKSKIKVTGLCHSVQGSAAMLARWIGAKPEEITYVCAGLNHQAWYIEFKKNGRDAYPLLRKAMLRKEVYGHERVRNEMFRHLGYYVTESSGHNSEYNWWFRKRQDLIRKFCHYKTGCFNPGRYAHILHQYEKTAKDWKKKINDWFAAGAPMKLERGGEYAAYIINAYMGGDLFKFNGNVPNTNIITNLPPDICVEVPVLATKRGFEAIHVGALPPQCAALNNVSAAVEEMAVEGCLRGDPQMVYHSVAYDPLSAAVLSLGEIKRMTREMLKKNRPYLTTFKNVDI